MLTLKLWESTTNVRSPRVHWEWASLRGVEGGVRVEGEEGASRDGGLSGASGLANEATAGDDGLRGGKCDIGEVRAEARTAAAALTADGLRGAEGSSGRIDVGLVRPEMGRLKGAKGELEPCARLEAEAEAGGLTLGVLVFLRISRLPRVRCVCS